MGDFLPICVEALAKRIGSDGAVASLLFAKLSRCNSASIKASVPRLLAVSSPMDAKLQSWLEEELFTQTARLSVADFGFDLLAGEFRPLAYSLLDALTANR